MVLFERPKIAAGQAGWPDWEVGDNFSSVCLLGEAESAGEAEGRMSRTGKM